MRKRYFFFLAVVWSLLASPTLASIYSSGNTVPSSASTWWYFGGEATTDVTIGNTGNGLLYIDNTTSNMQFVSQATYLGASTNSVGTVSLAGAGTSWTTTGDFLVGVAGTGKLSVGNDATLTVGNNLSINSTSQMMLLPNGPSSQVTTTGNLTNDGTICMFVDAWADAGTFTPISVGGTWSGAGTVEAFGGVWNDTAKTLTVSPATQTQVDLNGSTYSIDLSQAPRMDFTVEVCPPCGIGVSFPEGTGTLDLTIDPQEEDTLIAGLDSELVSFVGTWDLDFPQGQEMLLSFDLYNSYSACDVKNIFIRLDETNYAPEYLNYSDGEISFTIDTPGEYAIGYKLQTPGPCDPNGDGKVDGSDVTILANHWQLGVGEDPALTWITYRMGDCNGDHKVDGSDVTLLANNWQYGVTTAATAVPEPSTIVLLVVGCLALILRQRFSRR